MDRITKSFKVKNPYRADQEIRQEVSISEDLFYDYTNVEWVAIDTEYLSLDINKDKLCVIQIASKVDGQLQVEIIYVFDKEPTQRLIDLLTNSNIEKLFHVFSSDMPRLEKFIGKKIEGKIFDTKVAGKIAWTNTQSHSLKNLIKMFADPNYDQKDNVLLGDWEVGPENWTNDQVYYMMQDVLYLDVLRERILEMARRRGVEDLVLESMKTLPLISNLYLRGYSENVFAY
jgi:ribonuclease D